MQENTPQAPKSWVSAASIDAGIEHQLTQLIDNIQGQIDKMDNNRRVVESSEIRSHLIRQICLKFSFSTDKPEQEPLLHSLMRSDSVKKWLPSQMHLKDKEPFYRPFIKHIREELQAGEPLLKSVVQHNGTKDKPIADTAHTLLGLLREPVLALGGPDDQPSEFYEHDYYDKTLVSLHQSSRHANGRLSASQLQQHLPFLIYSSCYDSDHSIDHYLNTYRAVLLGQSEIRNHVESAQEALREHISQFGNDDNVKQLSELVEHLAQSVNNFDTHLLQALKTLNTDLQTPLDRWKGRQAG